MTTNAVFLVSGDNATEQEYTIKENSRAKHVQLKLSRDGALEVVVPRGYDHSKIPDLIATKKAWLQRTRQRLSKERKTLPDDHFERQPNRINLRAIGQHYDLEYQHAEGKSVTIKEVDSMLVVTGAIEQIDLCALVLRKWLHNKAQVRLVPWLYETSLELNLPYRKVQIRNQKTRWGSCSTEKAISLNCKLLFVPPEQVHYLFAHELCHTRHLNHSRRYWSLVEQKLPEYACLDAALAKAWRYVPAWAG